LLATSQQIMPPVLGTGTGTAALRGKDARSLAWRPWGRKARGGWAGTSLWKSGRACLAGAFSRLPGAGRRGLIWLKPNPAKKDRRKRRSRHGSSNS